MLNERTIINELEFANVGKLVELLRSPDAITQGALRAYFGAPLFQRLTALALSATTQYEQARCGKANVVFIPDFLGSALSALHEGERELLWFSPASLVDGVFERLKLRDDGITAARDADRIRATGVLKIHYAEILLQLAQHYNVFAFAYDWRKHPRLAATDLDAALMHFVGSEEPFHFVSHGSGALIVRAYLQQFGSSRGFGRQGSEKARIVMLGPPLSGTFWAAQMLAGTSDVERSLGAIDQAHTQSEIAAIVRTFPGLYMLLPAPGEESTDKLYDAATYGKANVYATHLASARSFHASMQHDAYEAQTLIIVGTGQSTAVGIRDWRAFVEPTADPSDASAGAYEFTGEGDGIVAVSRARRGEIPTYYVQARHDQLVSSEPVLLALRPLLRDGAVPKTEEGPLWLREPAPIESAELTRGGCRSNALIRKQQQLAQRLALRGVRSNSDICFTQDDHALLRGSLAPLLSPEHRSKIRSIAEIERAFVPDVEVAVRQGSIAADSDLPQNPPVDAIVLGHYRDAPLSGAIHALDLAVTSAGEGAENSKEKAGPGILATLFARGIAGQEVGQIFCLPDPRHPHSQRLLMIAGMGPIGKFGGPEATRLAHEITATAALLGKKHIVMTVIGSGEGNLTIREAVSRILQGVKDAKWAHGNRGVERITFMELYEERANSIRDAVKREGRLLQQRNRLTVRLVGPSKVHPGASTTALPAATNHGVAVSRNGADSRDNATRITILREGDVFTFSALTHNASIPERRVDANPALVDEANNGLVHAATLAEQREWGILLGKLLLPPSFRSEIFAGQSVAFLVNREAAQIHWEMLADTDWSSRDEEEGNEEESGLASDNDQRVFLGIDRGLTRQLQTQFAPPPQPSVAKGRVLRVLIIADPATDAPLPGAKEEGAAVAAIFEQYNKRHATTPQAGLHAKPTNRVEITCLFGADATPASVLKALTTRTFDVLHFAGHCGQDEEGQFGWIFQKNPLVRITRRELSRVERVPSFVFSNACESGITSGRADLRKPDLAPSFAEAVFACGVSNFVCTAWPIDDHDAQTFALVFYATLLGLEPPTDLQNIEAYADTAEGPSTIQQAMMRARRAIAFKSNQRSQSLFDEEEPEPPDARTWGAYQHYGNPSFRLFV